MVEWPHRPQLHPGWLAVTEAVFTLQSWVKMVDHTWVRINNEWFPLFLIHLLPGMDVFTLHRKTCKMRSDACNGMRSGQALSKLSCRDNKTNSHGWLFCDLFSLAYFFLNCGITIFLLVFAVLLAKIFENKAELGGKLAIRSRIIKLKQLRFQRERARRLKEHDNSKIASYNLSQTA